MFACTADSEGAKLPAQFGPWVAVKTVEMTRGEPMPGVDVDDCLDDIAAHGLHLTDAHVRITDQVI